MGFEQQNMVMIIDNWDELMLVDDKFGDYTRQHIWDSYHNPSLGIPMSKAVQRDNKSTGESGNLYFVVGGGFLQKSKPKPLEWWLKIGCWPFYMDFQLEIVG